MKTIRISVREVAYVTYEVEVDDDFTDFENVYALGDYLWADGVSPDPISSEVDEEEIQDAWEVAPKK